MVVLGLLLTFTVIKFSALVYGTATLPVTAQMLDMIGGGMSLFLIIIITFYAGEMVWRERSMSVRSEEHTSELQSLMRISYAVFCLKKKKTNYENATSKYTKYPHIHT